MTNDQQVITQSPLTNLLISPSQVIRGTNAVIQCGSAIARLGKRLFVIGGDRSLAALNPQLQTVCQQQGLEMTPGNFQPDCCETSIQRLQDAIAEFQAEVIIGTGGGKALDLAKLLAYRCGLPIVTIPTSGATCAAWTALSNIYTEGGAFRYDVTLDRCPDLLILDYDLVQTAPSRLLIAGIGDAIAKWYEASVSSGTATNTLIIAAVQQARVLRDILLQKSAIALQNPGSDTWREVVDATVLLAGVIGGLGGAQCRTVAAHAVHNGLTQIAATHGILHGEKVAFGILVQLRLEEMLQGNQLAFTARQQLLKFYQEIGLPASLEDLGLGEVSLSELRFAAAFACQPESDIHHLPFPVTPEQVMAAMVSTTQVPVTSGVV